MNISEPIIAELKHEGATTRRLLERVPQDALLWQPHEKSMTLGRLAAHIAGLPRLLVAALTLNEYDTNDLRAQSPAADSVSSILEAFDKNIAEALESLKTLSEERLLEPWRYRNGEQLLFEMPRLAVIRFVVLNHIVHHRGQLSVYLRLRDVPLPPVYGPTADESPF
ncbi:MAG TPA: DinB family protein [Pyrinomonadaceae bacterium]|jgi:uncharacterized damage-inducible protein DinB